MTAQERAHRAGCASVRALRRMIDALETVRATARLAEAEVFEDQVADETVTHELVRLREMEQDYVTDLLAIEEEGGPRVPLEYRAARAEGNPR